MREVVIDRINVIDYRMDLKRPYGTARGVTRASRNFLVRVYAEHNGREVAGVGEAQPRHRLTGDVSIDVAWSFLQKAAETLRGRTLLIGNSEQALNSVRSLMSEMADLARMNAVERNSEKPFRGTLLGIEVAVLDLVSRAMDMPLSRLLGEQRSEVAITVSTLSTQNSEEAFRRKVERQARYPMVRVKGIGNLKKDLNLLALVHAANQSAGNPKPIWMDNNEGFDEAGALEFIQRIAEEIKEGKLPEIITLEQPLHGSLGDRLPILQARANELTSATGVGDIRIMPDESLWDLDDLETVHGDGGCRAMNIKTAKAGGLLASLDLAREAVEINPETHICVGGMIGTSDITTWSLLSLAKALPRLDYITAVPPGNVKKRISKPLTKFKSPTSNIHLNSDEPGIGATLDEDAIAPFIQRQEWYPESAASSDAISGSDPYLLLRAPTKPPSQPRQVYRVLFLGDFHYGENYVTGGGTVLPERGYAAGIAHLSRFIDKADSTIANLETPVVDPATIKSPYQGRKRFIHWSDESRAPEALKRLGVDAVSLANNHALDYGREGLVNSLKALREVGLQVFGAGTDLESALKPLTLPLPPGHGGGSVVIHASMLRPQREDPVLDTFAGPSQAGCAPIAPPQIDDAGNKDAGRNLYVAFPHWGPNYKWRSARQKTAGRELVRDGFDLVIGHGAHCLQEFGRSGGKWIAYGIGNGHFQARGRYDKFVATNGIVPYSYWTMLTIESFADNFRRAYIRLYPVLSDNKETDFQPQPVKVNHFRHLLGELYKRGSTADFIESGRIVGGQDELGYFLELELDLKQSAAQEAVEVVDDASQQGLRNRLKAVPGLVPLVRSMRRVLHSSRRAMLPRNPGPMVTVDDADPGATKVDEPEGQEARILRSVQAGRTLGTQLIADHAEQDGADVKWFGGATCIVSWGERRILLQGNRAVESSVGSGIIKDKFLTKAFLQRGGSRAPEGHLARSSEDAVRILQQMGRPVVVKPRLGDRGRAISVAVQDESTVRTAYKRAAADRSRGGVLVEEYIRGDEYRCLVTDEECISVVKRVRPNVTGDGVRSIADLIEVKNAQRQNSPVLHDRPIRIDAELERALAAQGWNLSDVPSVGERVTVKYVGNISQGAEPHEVSDQVSQDLKSTAVAAVRAIPGMKWAGVDVLVSEETGLAYVLEINSNSGLGSHHFPARGAPRDVAGRIWQQRKMTAVSDETGSPILPSLSEVAVKVTTTEERLSGLLRRSILEDSRSTVEYLGAGTYEVSTDSQTVEWIRGCNTTRDLSAVTSVVRRHGAVRRILRSRGVDVAGGRTVRDFERLTRYALELNEPFNLVGYLKPWDGAWNNVYTPSNFKNGIDLVKPLGPLVVQPVAEGYRLRIVTSPRRVLLVLGENPMRPSMGSFERAMKLAVNAVRAIPELRWACVDVMIKGGSSPDGIYVEGMSLNPIIRTQDLLFAGSLAQFAREILGTA